MSETILIEKLDLNKPLLFWVRRLAELQEEWNKKGYEVHLSSTKGAIYFEGVKINEQNI